MPFFAVIADDRPGTGAEREALRPAHRKRLRDHDHPVAVRVGGPLLDENGMMNGSLLIIEAASREAVLEFLKGDPYVAAGLYGRCEVRPFSWGLGRPEADGHG